jgi:hypothetical protein
MSRRCRRYCCCCCCRKIRSNEHRWIGVAVTVGTQGGELVIYVPVQNRIDSAAESVHHRTPKGGNSETRRGQKSTGGNETSVIRQSCRGHGLLGNGLSARASKTLGWSSGADVINAGPPKTATRSANSSASPKQIDCRRQVLIRRAGLIDASWYWVT